MTTLAEVLEETRLKIIDQMYDEWGTFYIVVERKRGGWYAVHPGSQLSKRAAIAWRNPDPDRYALQVGTWIP